MCSAAVTLGGGMIDDERLAVTAVATAAFLVGGKNCRPRSSARRCARSVWPGSYCAGKSLNSCVVLMSGAS